MLHGGFIHRRLHEKPKADANIWPCTAAKKIYLFSSFEDIQSRKTPHKISLHNKT
jgi:hypothetical protein